ncbi:MAG TPA: endonuclease MutS2 [Hungateiclostridium thermocellum]|uniref:Endonuclease MutS2 n=1 Tax=Acetivibrio thermocellus (strain ATCC 27405 / DSM 1237 / JCM 9322 / NBRC 103400 / NCIMB 10682 / NRRL B-4536 / VPI 7372) TaxID=203119 RepID=MUTS2_ACET2|nr:endonuclease MutS2 [Acetivibrio thermocellus]A3DE67.1 RecName: Full=Endonuclease MutS2 [Acetivibrio thermocellus ATCC 27405]CDG35708.1 MutS2 protein [Acetivibrio thermocellus BC1]ABN52246.1 MutS2 family protein [Acetivibrio thermocellus ATCC 27405]THJ77029.1 endonuclease MutS2 [Acetivibrio thermocellus]UWV48154.1 endonuclease MutS2 [Acetivibrio thermocellus]HBW26215.1 endonuclease MutS2 [Acetivibrio thermocellus]
MNEKTLKILEFNKIIDKLVSLATSSLGKELAEKLVPDTDLNRVERAQKETSDAVAFIARRGTPPMGGIHDIRDSLKRVEIGAILNPGELLKTADVLRAVRNLKSYASNDRIKTDEDNIVSELIGCLESNKRIEDRIYMSILSEDEIADNASPTLANIRRQIRNAQESIKDKLNDIIRSSRYQKYIQEPIVTLRGDRYVIPVKQEYRTEIPGLIHDSSASGATIFIEPMAVVEANNHIRELKIKEQAEIEKILGELTGEIRGIVDSLKSNVSILGRLDFIFAKARLSLDYNCVCPVLNDEHKILIKKGRHPLLDKKTVVPIDFWIGEDFNTLVVTGPNTGGKTVTLKTVGLFTLMTQAGLHIPANEGTKMSIFKKVYADIGDEQSIEQSLSTFSSHMKNIVGILKDVDEDSLVLFDELGAGTDPTEGAALAMSILEYLRNKGSTTVATTHYSQLKAYAVTTKFVENACCEFNVETLRPTYRLLIGVPGKSNAFAISKRLGLFDDIIEKAKEFLTQDDIKFEDMLMSIEKNLNQSENEKMKAESYRLEAEKLKKELEEQKRKLAENRERLIQEARAEARKILLEARKEAEEIISKMRRLEQEVHNAQRQKEAEELRLKLKRKVDSIEETLELPLAPKNALVKPPENLKPGDSVLIVNLDQKGTVITPPDKDGEVVVQAGIMKINVHISNLKLVDEQKIVLNNSGIGKIGMSKAKSISTEIDVRGYNLEEAIESVDKYLDDAYLSGLTEVSIIHGKGTGVLRSGIQKFLKSDSRVKSFRLGKYGEGESGVTIVELR